MSARRPPKLTRRRFLGSSSAGVLLVGSSSASLASAACGADEKPRRDTLDAALELELPSDTVPAELPIDAVEPADTADTQPLEAEIEVETGPSPIGRFDPSELLLAARSVFLFGVQSGDPTPEGAVLWTRFSPAAGSEVTLELRLFEDGLGNSAGDLYLSAPVTPLAGGFVHTQVALLAADTRYRFCFVVIPQTGPPTERSPLGRFRTALALDAQRVVVFGGSSCLKADYQPYRVLNRAAQAELDFFVLAGDTTYCDGALTLDEFRAKWLRSFDSDGYRALFGNLATYATWDDHEVEDDWDPELVLPELRLHRQGRPSLGTLRQPVGGVHGPGRQPVQPRLGAAEPVHLGPVRLCHRDRQLRPLRV